MLQKAKEEVPGNQDVIEIDQDEKGGHLYTQQSIRGLPHGRR